MTGGLGGSGFRARIISGPYTQGLYGCKSSKQLFRKYYGCALVHWDCGDKDKSIFYLGAAVHLVQDATIPQHGSVKLLKSHRKYEQWIQKVHDNFLHYSVLNNGIYLENPFDYIEKNAKEAIEAYTKYSLIKDPSEKFFRIANRAFPLAQKTTAGCLMNFYKKLMNNDFFKGHSGKSSSFCQVLILIGKTLQFHLRRRCLQYIPEKYFITYMLQYLTHG